MFHSKPVDDAMANLHSAISESLSQTYNRVQESASWTVDELTNELQRVITEGGPNISLLQIFEAGACFAAERIVASVIPAGAEAASEAPPGMAS